MFHVHTSQHSVHTYVSLHDVTFSNANNLRAVLKAVFAYVLSLKINHLPPSRPAYLGFSRRHFSVCRPAIGVLPSPAFLFLHRVSSRAPRTDAKRFFFLLLFPFRPFAFRPICETPIFGNGDVGDRRGLGARCQ